MASLEMPPPPRKKFAPSRTHAATWKKASASTSSTLENLFDMLTIVKCQRGSHSFEECAQKKLYNLQRLTGSSYWVIRHSNIW